MKGGTRKARESGFHLTDSKVSKIPYLFVQWHHFLREKRVNVIVGSISNEKNQNIHSQTKMKHLPCQIKAINVQVFVTWFANFEALSAHENKSFFKKSKNFLF